MVSQDFKAKQIEQLNKLIELQKEIADISVVLEKLYPVAIIKDNVFYVFDFEQETESYEYKCEFAAPMPINGSICAAFDLYGYDERMGAVITDDVFEVSDGYIFIFHEFVHCYQYENGQPQLKSELKLNQKSREEGNYMWELTYEFPYEDESFVNLTSNYELLYANKDLAGIKNHYHQLKASLDELSCEYMFWEQWGEGHARYVENLIRAYFKLEKDSTAIEPPYGRGVFYEMGSRYIELLVQTDKSLVSNITELYRQMSQTDNKEEMGFRCLNA